MITRRGLLAGILVTGTAPVIVRAGILMPIRPSIITPARIYLWCICSLCTGNYVAWGKGDSEWELQAFAKRLSHGSLWQLEKTK